MWLNLRGMLAALIALTLLVSTGWAQDFDFFSAFAEQEAEATQANVDACCADTCGKVACCDPWCLRNSMYEFFAFDGWANEPDDHDANNFGFRLGLNAGIPAPLLRDRGIGMQIGASIGFYDLSGRQQGRLSAVEDQTMLTVGLFKRSNCPCGDPFSWAIVYDHQFHNDFGLPGADSFSMYASEV